MQDFEQLPHTADIKIRVYGKTKEQLFTNALIGMFQIIGPQAKGCTMQNNRLVCDDLPIVHTIDVESFDQESLLVDFLSEALYLSDINNEAYLHADIHELTNKRVQATLHGVKVQGFEVVEIKAVTYHELNIKQIKNIWQADIVFDI